MAARVRLWRLRTNPLRRRCDRVEGWVSLGAVLVFTAGGTWAGWATADAVREELDRIRAERQRTPAVLLENAVPARLLRSGRVAPERVWAEVRWTAADGSRQTGRAHVGSHLEKGERTAIWTDDAGQRVVSQPPDADQVAAQSALAGAGAGMLLGALVLGGRHLVRLRLDAQREQAWERDWERVEPQWRQGSTDPPER